MEKHANVVPGITLSDVSDKVSSFIKNGHALASGEVAVGVCVEDKLAKVVDQDYTAPRKPDPCHLPIPKTQT